MESYHRKQRYLEMELNDLDFGTKKRSKKYSFMEVESKKIDSKKAKLEESVDGEESDESSAATCNIVLQVEGEGYKNLTDFESGTGTWQYRDAAVVNESDNLEEMERAALDIDVGEKLEEKRGDQRRKAFLESEQLKLEQSVKKLTIDNKNKVDHREALDNAAKNLNVARRTVAEKDGVNLENLKARISSSSTTEEFLKIVSRSTEIQRIITNIEHSKILEQLMSISSMPDNPIKDFPLDINRNHYCDIINFALKHAPDVLGLVLKLATKNEAPIDTNDVVRCAHMFSTLACSVSRFNNALKKTKSVTTKNNGLTNNGMDLLSNVGIFETSRCYRNDRDYLASLSHHILMSHARISVPQVTFDNMDMNICNILHHMTLPFLEFEIEDTSELPREEKSFDEALEYFTLDTILITSDFNQDLFSHYQYVTAWALAKVFSEEVEGFSWMKKAFPKHYNHPNKESSAKRSIIFTQKPLNYSENSNADMIKIMEQLQKEYLTLVGQHSETKEVYFKDLKLIYSVDAKKEEREAAEERIKVEVVSAGEMICHGDLLTDVRFETCKRLRRMAVTAVERFDFMKIFRLGTFHMEMNKIMQDIGAGMKNEVNVDDVLSLGYFKTTLGLHHLSNKPEVIKKDGNFEHHSQFCEDVGKELLVEAFNTFVKNVDHPTEKSEEAAVKLILEFLKEMDIKYYYDPSNYEEKEVHDSMMSSCRDNAARTVVSLVLDAVEHEGDGKGLRAVRTVMIPYFLNRKVNVQDSKYASRLLMNRISFLQASKRTQARVDLMACCNPSGKPGHCIARDKENEHKVKTVKQIFKGMHSQLGDLPVEKAVLGSNILDMIEGHDREAMLVLEEGGKASYRYLSLAQKQKIRENITKMKPFNYNREKVDFYDEIRGVFSGLTSDQLSRFLTRNKVNFSRNSPHQSVTNKKPQREKDAIAALNISDMEVEECSAAALGETVSMEKEGTVDEAMEIIFGVDNDPEVEENISVDRQTLSNAERSSADEETSSGDNMASAAPR